jgi:hypothetical protein
MIRPSRRYRIEKDHETSAGFVRVGAADARPDGAFAGALCGLGDENRIGGHDLSKGDCVGLTGQGDTLRPSLWISESLGGGMKPLKSDLPRQIVRDALDVEGYPGWGRATIIGISVDP